VEAEAHSLAYQGAEAAHTLHGGASSQTVEEYKHRGERPYQFVRHRENYNPYAPFVPHFFFDGGFEGGGGGGV
jgi:hypothetical protein